jgi:hypothetical protein
MVNPIKVLPNTAYYCKAPADTWLMFFDENDKVIEGYSTGLGTYQNANRVKNSGFTTPSGAAYLRAYCNQYFASATTYNHDICINLSNSETNGKYFPHIEAREDLSIVRKYFPDGMKSAGSAHDEIRYNKASGKWEKVVRIGEVDMGSLPWGRNANGSLMLMNATIADIAPANTVATYTNNILQIRYPFDTSGGTTLMTDKTIRRYSRSIYVRDDAYTDAASFKAAMAGVMLYYELAEPIVTEIEETDFNTDYKVWNGGTEQMITDGPSSALRADITYGFNATGLLKQIKAALVAAGIM